ncbi:hypothetical protein [Bifidobacterium parmae]|uniref:Lipoprotein n=1 Tax=Bifidobacterium parmae TaxID=361854 RepID=A0A2N5IW86_9BIFI|nr:hypothetical protein [Bifidobacterium parmae]PLS26224.1 hypothetical protein Uis4E_1799 [Bifidobacterium parmae]
MNRTIVTVAVISAMCVALAGCGIGANGADGGDAAGGDGSAAASSATCKAPDFSGPYADEFKREYGNAKTELAKHILEDCQVTDAELNEILAAQQQCLAPYGLVANETEIRQMRGSLSDQEILDVQEDCAKKTDWWNVQSIYQQMRDNPDNLDAEALARASYRCYVKHDLLPGPLSEDEYIDTMTVSAVTRPSAEQITEADRRYQEFFGEYFEQIGDRPNPDFKYGQNTQKGHQFYLCETDPLHQ